MIPMAEKNPIPLIMVTFSVLSIFTEIALSVSLSVALSVAAIGSVVLTSLEGGVSQEGGVAGVIVDVFFLIF